MGSTNYIRQYIAIALIAIFLLSIVFAWQSGCQTGLGPSAGENGSPTTEDASTSDIEVAFELDNVSPSIIGAESATIGNFGYRLESLESRYAAIVEAATQGDPASQFEASRILFECKGIPLEKDEAEYVATGVLNEEMAAFVHGRRELCAGLLEKIPNISEVSQRWLRFATLNGYPLAMGRTMIFMPGRYTHDEARDIVLTVVREQDVEAYYQIVAYFANYLEDDVWSYAAWSIVACRRDTSCNERTVSDEIKSQYMPADFERILDTATMINKAIYEERWEDLNL